MTNISNADGFTVIQLISNAVGVLAESENENDEDVDVDVVYTKEEESKKKREYNLQKFSEENAEHKKWNFD